MAGGCGKNTVKLPFGVDFGACQSLTDQIVCGFRTAIAAGVYETGDQLPSIRSVSATLGVSEIVVRSAYARLAERQFVAAHTRRGTVVAPKAGPVWRGHVLCVMTDFDYNPQMSVILPKLRARLESEGYLFSQTHCLLDADGRRVYAGVERALMRGCRLVILLVGDPGVEQYLSSLGVPFCVLGGAQQPSALPRCIGRIPFPYETALSRFATRCRRLGLRKIALVGDPDRGQSIVTTLRAKGVKPTWIPLVLAYADARRFERAFQAGFRLAQDLNRCRRSLSEVLLVLDDFVATGIMNGFAALGVRIPEDVRLATFATGGNGPFFQKNVATIELDVHALGERAVGLISDYLQKSRTFLEMPFAYVYSPGETC